MTDKQESKERKNVMKLAVHMSMFCKNWTDDITDHLKKVKELGFDGAEISLYGSTDASLEKAFSTARELGLEVICGTGVSPDTDPSSSDETVREAAAAYLMKCVDRVAQAGGPFLNGVLYAPWQGFSSEDRKTRWENAAPVIRKVADYAAQKNVGLNLEVINRFETDFFNRVEEGVDFLKLVGAENAKLLVDTFHMNIEEDDICKALEENLPYIGCIHVCENHRGVPGTGHLDWNQIISVLKKNGYEGYLDMETFVESGSEVGKAMFIWEGRNRDPYQEAENGIRYLRSVMGVRNIYKEMIFNLSKVFNENAQYLCKLDCEAGDGDHGITISRGFTKAYESSLELSDTADCNEVFKNIGYAMLANMGGASGPIFSMLFIQTAILMKDQRELTADIFKKSIDATIREIHELTGTNRGEKTMLDAMFGVKDVCDAYKGDDLVELMELAQEGAHQGSLATKDMKATKGRAKFLQERSRGFLDAGSYSVYLIFKTIYETWRTNK